MVDIRRPVCGILVGGSPAPGINGVISAVVIQCIEWNLVPIGFRRGFKYLKQGLTNNYVTLAAGDVTRMHDRGGSILATSKEQLVTEEDISTLINERLKSKKEKNYTKADEIRNLLKDKGIELIDQSNEITTWIKI